MGNRRESNGTGAKAAGRRLRILRRQLGAVRDAIASLTDRRLQLSREEQRNLEALRRRRAALMIEIEKCEHHLRYRRQGLAGNIVQGPKGGVRSVVQSGSPGLGRRA